MRKTLSATGSSAMNLKTVSPCPASFTLVCKLHVRVADDSPALFRVEVAHDRSARSAAHGRAPEHRKIAVQFGFGVTYRIDHFDRRDAPEIELGTKRHVRTEIVVAERIGLKSQSVSLRINEHGKVRVGHGLIGSNWKTARSGRRTTAQFLFLREKTPELRSSIRRSPGFHCLSSGKTESGRRSRRSLAFSAAPIAQNATNAPSPARCLDLFVGDRPFLSGAHAAGFRSKVPAGSAVRNRPSRQGDRAAPRAAELFQSGSTCEIAKISPHAPSAERHARRKTAFSAERDKELGGVVDDAGTDRRCRKRFRAAQNLHAVPEFLSNLPGRSNPEFMVIIRSHFK